MTAISFTVFLFFPVAAPPRLDHTGNHPSMIIISAYDGSFNCFPSLHAAFLFYMAALGWRLFGTVVRPIEVGLCVIWGTGILYATIAIRQHYVLDLVAGAAVGCLSYWLAWRGSDKALATMPCNSGVKSQLGVR